MNNTYKFQRMTESKSLRNSIVKQSYVSKNAS